MWCATAPEVLMKLTDARIAAAPIGGKPVKLYDGKGLFLLLNPNGSRYWRFKYRYGGREQCISMGLYPEVTIAAARRARDEARSLVSRGVNPSEERQAKKRRQIDTRPRDGQPSMEFEEWFIERHGSRPQQEEGTDEELIGRIRAGKEAQALLDEREEWDARFVSAWWAWERRLK